MIPLAMTLGKHYALPLEKFAGEKTGELEQLLLRGEASGLYDSFTLEATAHLSGSGGRQLLLTPGQRRMVRRTAHCLLKLGPRRLVLTLTKGPRSDDPYAPPRLDLWEVSDCCRRRSLMDEHAFIPLCLGCHKPFDEFFLGVSSFTLSEDHGVYLSRDKMGEFFTLLTDPLTAVVQAQDFCDLLLDLHTLIGGVGGEKFHPLGLDSYTLPF